MNKKIGDYLYTANARFKRVTMWEIIGVTEKQYHCKEVRTNEFRYFSINNSVIFDTEEEAMQAIENFNKKENLKLLFLSLPIVIIMAILLLASI